MQEEVEKLMEQAAEALLQTDYATGLVLSDRCIQIYKQLGDTKGVSNALLQKATLLCILTRVDEAIACVDESFDICKETGDLKGQALTVTTLGNIANMGHDFEKAKTLYSYSLNIYTKLHDKKHVADLSRFLGHALFNLGEYKESVNLLRNSLRYYAHVKDNHGAMFVFLALAGNLAALNKPSQAVCLWTLAGNMHYTLGMQEVFEAYVMYAEKINAARKQLGEQKYRNAVEKGRNMDLDDAVIYAIQSV